MNENERKRKQVENLVKAGGLAIVGFLVAPFVFLAVQGLIGLALSLAIGYTSINMLPWFAAKVGNWKLKALKHEAAKNPIETLQRDFQLKTEALANFAEAIKTFTAKIRTFTDKVTEFKREYPSEASKFEEQLAAMNELRKIRIQKYNRAKEELAQYELEIDKADAIWQMAKAAAEMSAAAGASDENILQKIQSETALDSVQTKINESFADLEMALLEENDSPATNQTVKNQTDKAVSQFKSSPPILPTVEATGLRR